MGVWIRGYIVIIVIVFVMVGLVLFMMWSSGILIVE